MTLRSVARRSIALSAVMGAALGAMPTARAEPSSSFEGFAGTWSLVGGESRYAESDAPSGMTLSIEVTPEALHYRSDTESPRDRHTRTEFTAKFDGTLALVWSDAGFLAPVMLALSESGGVEATYVVGLKKTAWSHWSLLRGGEEMRVTTTYHATNGEERCNQLVFRRARV